MVRVTAFPGCTSSAGRWDGRVWAFGEQLAEPAEVGGAREVGASEARSPRATGRNRVPRAGGGGRSGLRAELPGVCNVKGPSGS